MRTLVWVLLTTLAVSVLLAAALGVFRPATGKQGRVTIQGMLAVPSLVLLPSLAVEAPAAAVLELPAKAMDEF